MFVPCSYTSTYTVILWLVTIGMIFFGALLIAVLHLHVTASLTDDPTASQQNISFFHSLRNYVALVFCCQCFNPYVHEVSTARLSVRVDITSGSMSGQGAIVEAYQALTTEGLGYLSALALSAACTQLLPTVPVDEGKHLQFAIHRVN